MLGRPHVSKICKRAGATYLRFLQVTQESTARGFRFSGGASADNAAVSDGVLLGGVSIANKDLESLWAISAKLASKASREWLPETYYLAGRLHNMGIFIKP